MVERSMRKEAIGILGEYRKAVDRLTGERKAAEDVIETLWKEADELREVIRNVNDNLVECGRKNASLRTWATIGKVATVVVGAGMAATIYGKTQ